MVCWLVMSLSLDYTRCTLSGKQIPRIVFAAAYLGSILMPKMAMQYVCVCWYRWKDSRGFSRWPLNEEIHASSGLLNAPFHSRFSIPCILKPIFPMYAKTTNMISMVHHWNKSFKQLKHRWYTVRLLNAQITFTKCKYDIYKWTPVAYVL